MTLKKQTNSVVTKTGITVTTNYCRKCMKDLPAKSFYECVDAGFIDSNGLQSVCKKCIQKLYDEIFENTKSMEKTIHKLCTSLNIMFSNDAISATNAHITTLQTNGKNVNAIFSIYKMKLTSIKKSMNKSGTQDMTYEDVGTIFTSKTINTKEIPIPQEIMEFWGKDMTREQVEFLEFHYANFKQTHSTSTYAEIILLKNVCHTMLNIKTLRKAGDSTQKDVRELQELMKNLEISPSASNASSIGGKSEEVFGLWIRDIETKEPAQWLKDDPRGDIYRDVGNVEEYFQKYIVRPLKNFILLSKDFNVEDDFDNNELDLTDEEVNKTILIEEKEFEE